MLKVVYGIPFTRSLLSTISTIVKTVHVQLSFLRIENYFSPKDNLEIVSICFIVHGSKGL